jgi:large subunit ribosomal protein L37Ae
MSKRTKKVGLTGKFGTRYGVVIRKNILLTEMKRKAAYECINCHHTNVRRIASGIWHCRHCDYTFAGGAYQPVYVRPKLGEADTEAADHAAEQKEIAQKEAKQAPKQEAKA